MLGVARRGRKDSDFENVYALRIQREDYIRTANRALSLTFGVALSCGAHVVGPTRTTRRSLHGTSFFLTS